MVRIGTLALRRLLLRCGSFRACYAQLDEAGAAALRKKVADPRGFAGLEFEVKTRGTTASSRWCGDAVRTVGCWMPRR